MRVILPSHLQSYTNGESEVEAHGATLADVLADLETRFRGLRFRVIDVPYRHDQPTNGHLHSIDHRAYDHPGR